MKRSLCLESVGDRLELGVVHDPHAAPDHLLEVGSAFDHAHEDQALKWPDIGAGSDHVNRHDDAGIQRVAERLEQVLWLAVPSFVGDLRRELVALPEDLAHHLHNVISVRVVLGEDQRLGDRLSSGEEFREEPVPESRKDQANLIGGDDGAVKLVGRVLDWFIDGIPSDPARHPIPVASELADLDLGPGPSDRGLDLVDREIHVHAVRYGAVV